jgi:chromosome segregation ATPase
LARANEERVDYQRKMLELTESIERTRIEVDKEQDSLALVQEQVTTLDQQCALITSLLPQVQNWISREEDLRRLNSSVDEMRVKLEAATKLVQEQTADLNGAETQQSELALTLLAARESQTDLQRTLESALRYVTNQHCPVCGLGHESKEMLENQIRQRIGMTSPSLEAAVARSREVEARIEKLKGEQIQSQSAIKSLRQEIDSILQTIDALRLEQQSFEQQILQLELHLDKNNLAAELNARLNTLVYELEEKRNDIVANTSRHDVGRKHLASLMADETELKAENKAKEVLSQRLSSTINNIESEALSKQVSLNENVTSVNDELGRLNKTLKELQGSLQAERLLVSKTESEYATLQNERSQNQQQIDSLTQRLSQLADSVSAFEAELVRLGLEKAVKLEELDSIILESETSLSDLELIKAELLRFELALDEVQLSAQLSKLNQEIDDLRSELHKLKSGHAHVNEWQVYFTKLKEELELVQRRSLKNYIDKYGPLTSSIQKRLRAVYGFGELKLQQEKGGIGLRVERKGQKNLAPADFFSEAQLQ